MFKTQAAYNKYYDEMRKYAQTQASKLSLGWEAIDKAMDALVNWIVANPDADDDSLFKYGGKIISNYFTKLSSNRSVEIIGHTPDGFTTYEIKDKRTPPRIRLCDVPEGMKRDIYVKYWLEGKTEQEIAGEVKVNQSTVSRTIKSFKE
jgi:hypothetical protein